VEGLIGSDSDEFGLPENRDVDDATGLRFSHEELSEYDRLKCFRRRDGSRGWADVRAVPIELPDLAGPLILVHLVDVTERQRAVEQLRVSEASFRAVFERSPVAIEITRLGPGGGRSIVKANEALRRCSGRP
jgi:PAS domain-containing protein